MIFPPIGETGQRALLDAHVTIVGVGATGSVLANHLARAGVGHLRLVDRDYLELNNLQRQVLYDEDDLAALLPKAVAAARKLRRINSSISIEDVVADVTSANIERLIADADVVLDGTDNFATRYLLNDACVKLGKPWVYSGVLASYGMTMTVRPGVSPCLRCIMGEVPAPGTMPTCDTAGILGPIVALLGSIAANEAIKLITGGGTLNNGMIYVDLWEDSFERFDLGGPQANCPTCGSHEYPFLQAERGTRTTDPVWPRCRAGQPGRGPRTGSTGAGRTLAGGPGRPGAGQPLPGAGAHRRLRVHHFPRWARRYQRHCRRGVSGDALRALYRDVRQRLRADFE